MGLFVYSLFLQDPDSMCSFYCCLSATDEWLIIYTSVCDLRLEKQKLRWLNSITSTSPPHRHVSLILCLHVSLIKPLHPHPNSLPSIPLFLTPQLHYIRRWINEWINKLLTHTKRERETDKVGECFLSLGWNFQLFIIMKTVWVMERGPTMSPQHYPMKRHLFVWACMHTLMRWI